MPAYWMPEDWLRIVENKFISSWNRGRTLPVEVAEMA